jgi:UPF0755 protein
MDDQIQDEKIKKGRLKLIVWGSVLLFFTFLVLTAFYMVLFPNVSYSSDSKRYLYINKNYTFDDVVNTLDSMSVLHSTTSFRVVANLKKYPKAIKSGRYLLKKGMSNYRLVNMLITGSQTPVMLTFNNIRTLPQLAGVLAKQLQPDSVSIMEVFKNQDIIDSLGFDQYSIVCNFIPNTYEVYWTISPKGLLLKMNKEYKRYWNDERLALAKQLGLSPNEVMTLASIVSEESNQEKEYSLIAGVYLNRVRKGMLLQADPTVKFALQDFSLKRILGKHLEVESPYNTYRKTGLPPGPICIPSVKVIDAVLHTQPHSYIYFCAKEDFSGYHNFAVTLEEHNQNARRYQRALNEHNIR